MVFNKQIGKLFNRKKLSDASPKSLGDEDSTDKTVSSAVIEEQVAELSGSTTGKEVANSEFTVLETYSLNAPYANVDVTKDAVGGNIKYSVREPTLTEKDVSDLQRLKTILNQVLQLKPADLQSKQAAGQYLVSKCDEVFSNYNFNLDPETKSKLLYYVVRDNLGFGKIDAFMHDPLIEDISCDGVNVPMFIWHRKFESIPTNVRFETATELDTYALRLAYLCGSHVSIAQPLLDA